ncbi:hypothetical protein HY385_01440 [Candidatus Daviesbacteria bacterium]|nr:hypothetical protein [Candidatus Daviesbacteria bacterium]
MEPAGVEQLQDIIQRIINLITEGAFIVLLVMLIMAGIRYITSGGEQKALQSAHNTLTWAMLGILFMVIAWLILLLIKAFTGVDVTKFCIGFDKCP